MGPVTADGEVDAEPSGVLRAVAAFDDAVDEAFAPLRGRTPADRIFYTATIVGEDGRIWLVVAALLALRPASRRKALRLLIWLGVETVLVNGPIKRSVKRPRPVFEGEHVHKIRAQTSASFPSGHSASSAAVATILSEGSRLWPLWWAIALVIAASRVHVRDHHASDVVGGLAIGTAIGLAGRRLGPRDR